jgi:hypothetical protein
MRRLVGSRLSRLIASCSVHEQKNPAWNLGFVVDRHAIACNGAYFTVLDALWVSRQNSCTLIQYATPATKAADGMVKIQAHTMLPATPHRTALGR